MKAKTDITFYEADEKGGWKEILHALEIEGYFDPPREDESIMIGVSNILWRVLKVTRKFRPVKYQSDNADEMITEIFVFVQKEEP